MASKLSLDLLAESSEVFEYEDLRLTKEVTSQTMMKAFATILLIGTAFSLVGCLQTVGALHLQLSMPAQNIIPAVIVGSIRLCDFCYCVMIPC